MKDTPPTIERQFRQMLMQLPGAKRLKMGCSMHATAHALAKAYLSERHPDAHPLELKRLLFLHFYNTDFKPEERKRIALALGNDRQPSNVRDAGKRTMRKTSDLTGQAVVKPSGAGAVREKSETYGATRKAKAKRPRRNAKP